MQIDKGETETLSVVVDSNAHRQTDIIQILEPPKVITNSQRLQISYHCSQNKVFGIEVISNTETQKKVRLFHKAWKCSKTEQTNRKLTLFTRFPRKYAFQPDFIQKNYEFLSETKIRVWILDEWQWETARRQHDAFLRAFVKASYVVQYPSPFSRPRRNFEDSCVSWRTLILLNISQRMIPKCPHEKGSFTMHSFLKNQNIKKNAFYQQASIV